MDSGPHGKLIKYQCKEDPNDRRMCIEHSSHTHFTNHVRALDAVKNMEGFNQMKKFVLKEPTQEKKGTYKIVIKTENLEMSLSRASRVPV